ncbi:MAG: hypothetical protein K1X51_16300 [Rhodospirillaceae bacterium]|nr:hypothetical protein [Rhodospirillaceae bacterium]
MVQHISDRITVAGQAIDRSTLNGLKTASAKSGVSFQYLLAKAAQESSLKTDATADTSSAAGLFQFTKGTWLEMMKRYGAQYGYGELVKKILTGASGKAQVADAAAESKILALREDPEASALMAAQYARDNASALHESLGRGVDAPDLYLAHFLGATGAGLLLAADKDDPDKAAASLMPAAAKANRSVFYDADGKSRTASEVVQLVRERFSAQMQRYAGAAKQVGAQETASAEPVKPLPAMAALPKASSAMINPMDLKAGLSSGDPNKMMQSWFVMEQLAQLIASKPMAMAEASDPYLDNTVSSGGFQGKDWAAAMSQSFSRDLPALNAPVKPLNQAARAYDAVKSHVAALLGTPRKQDL